MPRVVLVKGLAYDLDKRETCAECKALVALNEPKPDLLQNEAQALVEGRADESGVFHANPGGLMLKCPTRYEEMDPAGHPAGVEMTN